MVDQARVLIVAAPDAPIRALEPRLQDADLLIVPCATAKAALDQMSLGMPDVVLVDASMPGAQRFQLYGRMRGSAAGMGVPMIFTNHTGAELGSQAATVPDYYLGPEIPFDDVEQLLFTFLPESLVEFEVPDGHEPIVPELPRRRPYSADAAVRAVQSSDLVLPIVYTLVIVAAEILAGSVNVLAGLALHAGAVVASFLHCTTRPPGPKRAFFSTFWFVPLLRIYMLSQPYVGLVIVWWWALTAIPMIVAAVVGARLAGFGRREIGLTLAPRDLITALLMLPVGIAAGFGTYLLLDPRPIARDVAIGYPWLHALVMVANPAFVQELIYRGVLLRSTAATLGSATAVALTGVVFAAAQANVPGVGLSVVGFGMMLLVGLILSAVRWKSGSLAPSTAGHAAFALSLFLIGPVLIPTGSTIAPAPTGDTVAAATPPAVAALPSPALATAVPPQAVASLAAKPALAPAPGAPPSAQQTVVVLATVPPAPPAVPAGAQAPAAGASPDTGPRPVQADQIFTVSWTGGSGARLRAQPSTGAQTLAIVVDATPLIVVGPDRAADGINWRQVRTPSGAEGWISSQFLSAGPEQAP